MNVCDAILVSLTTTCLCVVGCKPAEKSESASSQSTEQRDTASTSPDASRGHDGTGATSATAPLTPDEIAAEAINRAGEAAEAEAMRIAAEGLPPYAIDDSADKPKGATKD